MAPPREYVYTIGDEWATHGGLRDEGDLCRGQEHGPEKEGRKDIGGESGRD